MRNGIRSQLLFEKISSNYFSVSEVRPGTAIKEPSHIYWSGLRADLEELIDCIYPEGEKQWGRIQHFLEEYGSYISEMRFERYELMLSGFKRVQSRSAKQ